MDKKRMQNLIFEALTKKLGDGFNITIKEILKTNIKRDALIIQKKGDNVSPNIYLENYYNQLQNGTVPEQIADAILTSLPNQRNISGQFDFKLYQDFDYVKDKLFVQLINVQLNEELLKDVPYWLFLGDFAIVIRCLVGEADIETLSFLVHNSYLNMWDTDTQTLFSIAIQNTRKLFGVALKCMNDIFMEQDIDLGISNKEDACPMWVLSNKNTLFGAATVLFDDILQDFAAKHGSFYVIFSSVHEILLIPSENDKSLDSMTQINQEVNTTQVHREEILGTQAYYYKQGSGFTL